MTHERNGNREKLLTVTNLLISIVGAISGWTLTEVIQQGKEVATIKQEQVDNQRRQTAFETELAKVRDELDRRPGAFHRQP